jgi:hypothetical protein
MANDSNPSGANTLVGRLKRLVDERRQGPDSKRSNSTVSQSKQQLETVMQEVVTNMLRTQQKDLLKPTQLQMMEMACNTFVKKRWETLLVTLPRINLSHWTSEVSLQAPYTWHLVRAAYEDFCLVTSLVPTFLLEQEAERIDALSDIAMGASIVAPVIPWSQESLLYWVATMTKHGPIAKAFAKRFPIDPRLADVAQIVAQSLSSAPILFSPDNVERVAHMWSSKTM